MINKLAKWISVIKTVLGFNGPNEQLMRDIWFRDLLIDDLLSLNNKYLKAIEYYERELCKGES